MQLTSPSQRLLRLCLAGLAAGLVLAAGGLDTASAYPQFQFTTFNNRCNLCHFSPSGGGLINGFGRDESAQTISSNTNGNGGFLHGVWQPPEWLALGADFRGAGLIKESAGEPQRVIIPMQADLYARVAAKGISLNVTGGLRGSGRTQPELADRLISREHYLMYEASSFYLRAGRYLTPYGLRLQDHTSYTRRYTGMYALEETYNLTLGTVREKWETHATFFMPPPFMGVGRDFTGGAFYYERRFGEDKGAYGIQSRVGMGADTMQYWFGGIGKLWLEGKKTLILSQADLGYQTFDADAVDPVMLLNAHLSATYMLRQGWMLGLGVERYDPDLLLQGTERDSLSLNVQYFPRAHFEIQLLGRLEAQGQEYGTINPMGLLMLHYYL